MSAYVIPLPDDFIDVIAERVAGLLADRQPTEPSGPWLTVAEAAERIRCPKSRIYALVSTRSIPFQKDGSRLLFHRDELDAWVRNGGGRRP